VKRNNNLVQVGRVGLINFGENSGKYVTILDVVDANKVRYSSMQLYSCSHGDNSIGITAVVSYFQWRLISYSDKDTSCQSSAIG
jgi:hypothetical protein